MMSYEGANAISVAPDFSDLEELIKTLRSYPHVVERVARFQREGAIGVFEYGGGDELLEGVGTG
jgi:hypothetical protein